MTKIHEVKPPQTVTLTSSLQKRDQQPAAE
jgi:hypothetical protein